MVFLLLVPILIFSIVLHEVAHAWVAKREGDDTAEKLGRITLNPIPHLDPVGSVVVPAILYLLPTSFLFGWARPVPVNPANYRDPKWGDIRVSLAGIAANLLTAAVLTVMGGLLLRYGQGAWVDLAGQVIVLGIFLNLILALFNLIPVPPLDGGHVAVHFLPQRFREAYRSFGRFGILAILAFLFLVPDGIRILLYPVELLMDVAMAFIRLWG